MAVSEALSTARPTLLRLAGFVCVALGAIAASIGATREWFVLGFAGDTEGAADQPVHGIDVWDGKVALFAAATALVVVVAMRIAGSGRTRRGLAITLIVLGVACVALAAQAAIGADDRFGGGEGVDRMAEALAVELGLPEHVVREQLAEQLEADLRVELRSGLWITAAGGVLLALGGSLGLARATRRSLAAPDERG